MLKGRKLSEDHRKRIAAAIKITWKEGRKDVARCPICHSFLGENHNCGTIREKQRRAKLNNPTRYWLGKKRNKKTILLMSQNRKGISAPKGEESYAWTGGCWRWYHNQARKIMGDMIGRKLGIKDIVHHKNKDWKDNRPENLQLMTRSEHIREHQNDLHKV